MSDEKEPLHLLQLQLRSDRLFSLARSQHLPIREVDSGYVVHAVLRALFGEKAPQPFALQRAHGPVLTVLGYASSDHLSLARRAREYAAPDAYTVVEWDGFASKPMPAEWQPGRRLGFRVRACPTVRMAKAGPHHAAGAEVDVFLAKCWQSGDPARPVDRERVYLEWLAAQFERRSGARVVGSTVVGFQIESILRRTQSGGAERRNRVLRKPEATFRGQLEVTNGSAFTRMLRVGIGRHRAFGFGMLLLHPVERC